MALEMAGLSPDGQTLGTPVAVLVRNKDQRSGDYSEMAVAYRPSHADATYDMKYGVRAVAVRWRPLSLRPRASLARPAPVSFPSSRARTSRRGRLP